MTKTSRGRAGKKGSRQGWGFNEFLVIDPLFVTSVIVLPWLEAVTGGRPIVSVAINLAHAAAIVQSKSPGVLALLFFQSRGRFWVSRGCFHLRILGYTTNAKKPTKCGLNGKSAQVILKKSNIVQLNWNWWNISPLKCLASPICAHIF